MLGNIDEFFNTPADINCAIKDWYISSTADTTQLTDSDPIAIRMNQVGRGVMDPLKVNLELQNGKPDLVIEFRLNVFMISNLAPDRVLHPGTTLVRVNIGCFNMTQLGVREFQLHNHPSFSYFN